MTVTPGRCNYAISRYSLSPSELLSCESNVKATAIMIEIRHAGITYQLLEKITVNSGDSMYTYNLHQRVILRHAGRKMNNY